MYSLPVNMELKRRDKLKMEHYKRMQQIEILKNRRMNVLYDKASSKMVLPIIENNNLRLFQITIDKEYALKLVEELNLKYHDTVHGFVPIKKYNEFVSGISGFIYFAYRPLEPKKPTKEDVWTHFNLDSEQNRINFVKSHNLTYNHENLVKVINHYINHELYCTFNRNSKLAEIIKYIITKEELNPAFISNNIYEYFYGSKADLLGLSPAEFKINVVNHYQFTSPELNATFEEKIDTLDDIIKLFKINLIYCEENNPDDMVLNDIFGTANKEEVKNYANKISIISSNKNIIKIIQTLKDKKQQKLIRKK